MASLIGFTWQAILQLLFRRTHSNRSKIAQFNGEILMIPQAGITIFPPPPRRILAKISQSAWHIAWHACQAGSAWHVACQVAPKEYYYIPISKKLRARMNFDSIKRESAQVARPENSFPCRTCSSGSFLGGVIEKIFQMESYRQENGAHFVLREFAIGCAEGGQ